MFETFMRLFSRCDHRWVEKDKGYIIHDPNGNSLASCSVIGTWTKFHCVKCGSQKTEKAID